MCTVTFLPTGKTSYILTSNRDESPTRAALPPQAYEMADKQLFFPKDPFGGTWIATDKVRFTLCLLNGAFIAHRRTPPYRLSRGLMVLEFFNFYDLSSFATQFDFREIEPFTLIIVDTAHEMRLHELRWDGEKLHVTDKDTSAPHIWSSSTLYPEPIIRQRKEWFDQWLSEHAGFSREAIIDFHKNGGTGDLWNDFVMKRGDHLQTVSITSIEKKEGFELLYEDLLAL